MRLSTLLLVVVVVVGVALSVAFEVYDATRPARSCRHSESSVGPVTIEGGRVRGSTAPAFTGCLP
jgi:hypothetical protein